MKDARKLHSVIIGMLISMFILVPADMLFGDRHVSTSMVAINMVLLVVIILLIIIMGRKIKHKIMFTMIAGAIVLAHMTMVWMFACI